MHQRNSTVLGGLIIAAWLAGCATVDSTPPAPASQPAPQGDCVAEPAQLARALLAAARANDAAAWNRLQAPRFRLAPGQSDYGRFAQWRRELLAHERALRQGPVRLHRDAVYEYLVAGPSDELTMLVTHLGGCLLVNES